MELIDGAEVRRLVGPIRPDVLGASFCGNDAQINTPTVVAALAAGARAEGADVREGVEVTGARRRAADRVVGVDTDQGRFDRRHGRRSPPARGRSKLLAEQRHRRPRRHRAAAGAGHRAPPARHPPGGLRPAGGQAVRAVPRSAVVEPVDDFLAPYEIETGNWMLQLVSQRANGETLIGCPMDYPAERHPRRHARRVCATPRWRSSDDFPGLRDVAIDRMWAGVLPYTSDQHPDRRRGASRPVRRRRPHLRQRRRTDDRASSSARCWPVSEPEIDMSACRWEPRPRAGRAGRHRALVSELARPRPPTTCAIRDAVRRFVDRDVIPTVAERERADAYPADLLPHARRARRAGHVDPRRARRQRLDLVGYALVFEELARGWMGLASVVGQLGSGCWLIARYGTEEQRDRYLARPRRRAAHERHRAHRTVHGQRSQGDQAQPPAAGAIATSCRARRR